MFCKGCTRQMRRMRKMRKGLPGKQYYNGKQGEHMKTKKKHWYDYLWIWSIAYFALGFFCCRSYSLHLAVTSFSATTFAAEGNSIVNWAEISNAPETSQHRNGWHPNGFDMVFWYFSLPCSVIWFFRPTLWQAVRKICVKQSNCFGPSVFRGDGHIRKVYSRIGWHSSASDFTAWCLHRF